MAEKKALMLLVYTYLSLGSVSTEEQANGLLATSLLNKHPTADARSFCCCASSNSCPPINKEADYGDINDADLVGSGLINVRSKQQQQQEQSEPEDDEDDDYQIGVRIVNSPPPGPSPPISGPNSVLAGAQCPLGSKTCCYSSKEHVSSLGSSCVPSIGGKIETAWRQGCPEKSPRSPGGKQCGARKFAHANNLKPGEASPDEFPWTCIILSNDDDFIGGCAIVPDNLENDISSGTKRVITVAHKLSKIKRTDTLKVRILEYDASGFTTRETNKHQEFLVKRFIKHPRYDPKRLSDDIAILILEKPINLLDFNGINAACYSACRNMFDYKFSNGTGTRCWVAGWGKDNPGGDYQFIQHKVDVPLYDRFRCETRIRSELSKTNPSIARTFSLHPGELCAGGEKGKDACEGDGGAPLVCQSESGLFHVVGLVAWGVDCALDDVPGIYVNLFQYLSFITQSY